MKLYKNIKKRRLELGLSQQKLAEMVGYTSKSMIARIEKEEIDLPESKINAFAKALRVKPGELMGYDDCVNDATEADPLIMKIAMLDEMDRARLEERIDMMLEDEKYKKTGIA